MKKYFLLCLCTINIGMYAQVAGTPYLMASQQVNVEVLAVGAGGGGGGVGAGGGGATTDNVVNVKSEEVARLPAASFDLTL